MLCQGEQEFVEAILSGSDAWPAYNAHMSSLNSAGPQAPVTMQAPEEIRHLLADTATGRTIAVLTVTLFALAAMRHVRSCRNAAAAASERGPPPA